MRERAPETLLGILRAGEPGMADLFEGLRLHYLECVTMGRMDAWARAGHAIIDLLARPPVEVVRRSTLPPN